MKNHKRKATNQEIINVQSMLKAKNTHITKFVIGLVNSKIKYIRAISEEWNGSNCHSEIIVKGNENSTFDEVIFWN